MLFDLGINVSNSCNMYCDNDSAIKLALNHVFHERTKHFEVDVHFVKEKISNNIITLVNIDSGKNIVGILTKGLNVSHHEFLVNLLGLFDPFKVS